MICHLIKWYLNMFLLIKQIMTNHLTKLIKEYPDKEWSTNILSYNPNITWNFIKDNRDLLPWSNLYSDDNVPSGHWEWKYISRSPNITWDNINSNLDYGWDWYEISTNPVITWDIIINNPNVPWDWNGISLNPNITWDIVISNLDTLPSGEKTHWNLDLLTSTKTDTPSWDFISKHLDKPWDWYCISANPNITWDIISSTIDEIPWDWVAISGNPNITLPIIISNLDSPWYWFNISKRMCSTPNIIIENPDLPWDWYAISMNPNITWEFITSNPDKPWNWSGISLNPNITFSIIKNTINNPEIQWDWSKMSSNKFNYDTYFQSDAYIKKMTKLLHDTIYEELIVTACHPRRVLNWNEDVNDTDNIYYGLTQEDINKLF